MIVATDQMSLIQKLPVSIMDLQAIFGKGQTTTKTKHLIPYSKNDNLLASEVAQWVNALANQA